MIDSRDPKYALVGDGTEVGSKNLPQFLADAAGQAAWLAPGTYLSQGLRVPSNASVLGGSRFTTILQAHPALDPETPLVALESGAKVAGISVEMTGLQGRTSNAIQMVGDEAELRDFSLRNVANADYGLAIFGHRNILERAHFTANGPSVWIGGDGTRLLHCDWRDTLTCLVIAGRKTYVHDATFERIGECAIYQNWTANGTTLDNIRMDGVKKTGDNGNGIESDGGGDDLTISNSRIENCDFSCVALQQTTRYKLDNCTLVNPGNDPTQTQACLLLISDEYARVEKLGLRPPSGGTISNCTFVDERPNHSEGIWFYGQEDCLPFENTTISGCTFIGQWHSGKGLLGWEANLHGSKHGGRPSSVWGKGFAVTGNSGIPDFRT